jgi:hypothetical protein
LTPAEPQVARKCAAAKRPAGRVVASLTQFIKHRLTLQTEQALVLAVRRAPPEDAGGITDMDEKSDLPAIAKNLDGLAAASQLVGKNRDNTVIWRIGVLSRTVSVEIAQFDRCIR